MRHDDEDMLINVILLYDKSLDKFFIVNSRSRADLKLREQRRLFSEMDIQCRPYMSCFDLFIVV